MWIKNFPVKSLALVFVFTISTSFVSTSDNIPEKSVGSEQTLAFNSDGLYYAEFYDYIFRGQFEHLEMKREDMHFLMIFEQYLRAFGRQCPSFLPTAKVEIMELECATEEVTTNGFGLETSRVCIKWRTVGTGLYARPDLYKAKQAVEQIQSADALQTTIAMITDPNAMGNSVDMIHRAKGLQNDMAQIFELNPCNSAGVRRFEENLKLFALNQPAIRMKESSKYTSMKKTGGPTGAQDLRSLVNDLVADQAKTWAFNHYETGSISGLIMQSTDPQGRPVEVRANYLYKSFGGSSKGSVRVSFANGLPKCIYFFDFPNNCKTPNSSILASYAQGGYGK